MIDSSSSTPMPSAAPLPGAAHVVERRFVDAAGVLLERCDILGTLSDDPLPRITRTFLSSATREAHEVVTRWMRDAGLEVRTDAAGNLIGRREASRPSPVGRTFAIGSHLDTVPNAGKYDGILGVVAGIALADLTRHLALPFALEVVGFSEEEGVRFGKPYIGSHAYVGTLDPSWLDLIDKTGVTVEEAIRDFGIDPTPLKTLTPRTDLLGYLEIHIEQGPVLERAEIPVAVVASVVVQTRLELQISGTSGHAGTTPMDLRHDALAAAAEIILFLEKIAVESKSQSEDAFVATVGKIRVLPNASNVIAGDVYFSIDMRHAKDSARREAIQRLVAELKAIAHRRGIAFQIQSANNLPAAEMNASLVRQLLAAAEANTGRGFLMHSGAGHDAAILAPVAPAGMLFVRSPGGISHNPLESVLPGDVQLVLATACTFLEQLQDPTPNPTQEPS